MNYSKVRGYNYKGYYIHIAAKFVKNGYQSFDLDSGYKEQDVVFLIAQIFDDEDTKIHEINREAMQHEKLISARWFRDNITKTVSIRKAYDEKLEGLCSDVEKYIDNRIYSQEVTDGIPDSLNSL